VDQPRLPIPLPPAEDPPEARPTISEHLDLSVYPPSPGSPTWTLLSTHQGPGFSTVRAIDLGAGSSPTRAGAAVARHIAEVLAELDPF
jgi:hypothetical protein